MFCVVKLRTDFKMVQQSTTRDEHYWGLFAVSDKWWCDKEKDGGMCNVKCSDLLTDIDKNVKCGRRIYKQDGPSSWKVSADCGDVEDKIISDCISIVHANFGSIGEKLMDDLPVGS